MVRGKPQAPSILTGRGFHKGSSRRKWGSWGHLGVCPPSHVLSKEWSRLWMFVLWFHMSELIRYHSSNTGHVVHPGSQCKCGQKKVRSYTLPRLSWQVLSEEGYMWETMNAWFHATYTFNIEYLSIKFLKHCLNKIYSEGQGMSLVQGVMKIFHLYNLYIPFVYLYIYIYKYYMNSIAVIQQENYRQMYSDAESEKQGLIPSPSSALRKESADQWSGLTQMTFL